MKRAVLETIVATRRAKGRAAVFTPLDGGDPFVWSPGDMGIAKDLQEAGERALATDDAFTLEAGASRVFVMPINPPLRLIIVGAVHIAEPLSAIAARLGYEVTIVDPREAFARAERWPGVTVIADWPEDVFLSLALDARTAVVALTHDPKIDDGALEAALRSPAFYVGALGSAKTHAGRTRRLLERGLDEATVARIHGPIGLRIGARSPGEIAVSIVAQMTEVLRRAPKAKSAT